MDMDYQLVVILSVWSFQIVQASQLPAPSITEAKYISTEDVRARWLVQGEAEQGERGVTVGLVQQVTGYTAKLSPTDTCEGDTNGKHLPPNQTSITFRQVVPGKLYTICLRAQYEEGHSEWKDAKVSGKAHVPASLTSTPRRGSVIFTHHDSINELCEASGIPKPEVNWYKGDRIVSLNGSLALHDLSSSDEGTYVCVAWNDPESKARSGNLNLKEAVLGEFPPNQRVRQSTIPRGEGVRLECGAPHSFPSPVVTWAKLKSANDAHPLPVTIDERITKTADNALLFVYTKESDAGLYQCEVTNSHLDSSHSGSTVELAFTDTDRPEYYTVPTLLQHHFFSVSAMAGEKKQLDCVFSGKPMPSTTWYKDGHEIKGDQRHKFGPAKHQLIINPVTGNDMGQYECIANNSEGRSHPARFKLFVHEQPHWTIKPKSYNATLGETVTFECKADGNPTPKIQWYINDQERTRDNLLSWQHLSDDNTRFTLMNVTKDYIMNFQCNASNMYGSIMKDLYMNVLLPTKIAGRSKNDILGEKKSHRFICEAETDPGTPLSVRWLKGSKPIKPDPPRVYVDQEWALVLNLTHALHGGEVYVGQYTCEASNGYTMDTVTVSLAEKLNVESQTQKVKSSSFSTGALLWVGLGSLVGLVVICLSITGIVRRRSRFRERSNTNASIITTQSRLSRQDSTERAGVSRPLITDTMTCNTSVCTVGDENLKLAVNEVYIARERLDLGHMVGKGQFGRVYMSIMKDEKGKLKERVAVKTLKYKAEETDMVELFLKEAVLMREFDHDHVLGLIGIAFDTDTSPMVVLPFMANGDLRQYILNPELDITVLQLLRMALQVARGMVYLTDRRFVHRDLAARNCMVSDLGVVKVADFGLSRELFKRDYYRIEDGKTPLPIRWMAPECIQSSVFTTQSDVWAYGILMWELITRGAVPYPEVDNWDITQWVLTGHRLGQPVYCPDSVFDIMRRCWHDAGGRPLFDTLVHDIDRVIKTARPGSTSSYRLYMNVGASSYNPDYRQTTV